MTEVEQVPFFDAEGRYAGHGGHQEAQDSGFYTRNVFTFLVAVSALDRVGGIVLQRRSHLKPHYGGVIDVASGGVAKMVPYRGRLIPETPPEAAEREHNEEIGLRVLGGFALIVAYRQEFPGKGKDGMRRHFTSIFVAATDQSIEEAHLQKEEVDELLLYSSEADLRAATADSTIPSLAAEVDYLLDDIRKYCGDEDPVRWISDNWDDYIAARADTSATSVL